MEIECAGFVFTSNFDSGNLADVKFVEKTEPRTEPKKKKDADTEKQAKCPVELPDYEFDIWTKPDCAGTEFANGNRTWFHFGMRGPPFALVKLNIINLNRQSKLFNNGMKPVYRMMPGKPQWERIRDRPTYTVQDNNTVLTFTYRTLENQRTTTYFAFTFPFTYEELQNNLHQLDQEYHHEMQTEQKKKCDKNIYYHRECVCFSLEGRRVDLITVSDYRDVSKEREPRLNHLFPLEEMPRPYAFPSKKVVFVSARVHPGETQSSFVMNGLLNFLLDPKDLRAKILRQRYVFKLVPMLNPDGVYRGHYRTDTRGVNLNRLYMNPSFTLHPSIYAARCLVMYHHRRQEVPYDSTSDEPSISISPEFEEGHCVTAHSSSSSVGLERKNEESETTMGSLQKEIELEPEGPGTSDAADASCAVGSCSRERQGCTSNSGHEWINILSNSVIPDSSEKIAIVPKNNEDNTDCSESTSACCTPPKLLKDADNNNDVLTSCEETTESGLYLYIDLHGHASKRGIFMYGNNFKDVESQVECMLFPKLMSVNSPNFDFLACNFTERNMYMKDKRDGLTKEGSGRVAVYKLTSLIRSYTLECNYNTGLIVNPVPNLLRDSDRMSPTTFCNYNSGTPPKYTPQIFEEVGKAMAISILDLDGSNPMSQICHTDFRTLVRLKEWLRRFCLATTPLLARTGHHPLRGRCSDKSATSLINSPKRQILTSPGKTSKTSSLTRNNSVITRTGNSGRPGVPRGKTVPKPPVPSRYVKCMIPSTKDQHHSSATCECSAMAKDKPTTARASSARAPKSKSLDPIPSTQRRYSQIQSRMKPISLGAVTNQPRTKQRIRPKLTNPSGSSLHASLQRTKKSLALSIVNVASTSKDPPLWLPESPKRPRITSSKSEPASLGRPVSFGQTITWEKASQLSLDASAKCRRKSKTAPTDSLPTERSKSAGRHPSGMPRISFLYQSTEKQQRKATMLRSNPTRKRKGISDRENNVDVTVGPTVTKPTLCKRFPGRKTPPL